MSLSPTNASCRCAHVKPELFVAFLGIDCQPQTRMRLGWRWCFSRVLSYPHEDTPEFWRWTERSPIMIRGRLLADPANLYISQPVQKSWSGRLPAVKTSRGLCKLIAHKYQSQNLSSFTTMLKATVIVALFFSTAMGAAIPRSAVSVEVEARSNSDTLIGWVHS